MIWVFLGMTAAALVLAEGMRRRTRSADRVPAGVLTARLYGDERGARGPFRAPSGGSSAIARRIADELARRDGAVFTADGAKVVRDLSTFAVLSEEHQATLIEVERPVPTDGAWLRALAHLAMVLSEMSTTVWDLDDDAASPFDGKPCDRCRDVWSQSYVPIDAQRATVGVCRYCLCAFEIQRRGDARGARVIDLTRIAAG